jgi:hypothetical protein
MLVQTVHFSINRWATVLRQRRGVKVDGHGNLKGRVPKDGTTATKLLRVPDRQEEGTQCFVRFLDETHNEADEFIRTFVDNPNVTKDPAFLKTLQNVRVSFEHNVFYTHLTWKLGFNLFFLLYLSDVYPFMIVTGLFFLTGGNFVLLFVPNINLWVFVL